MILTRNKYRHSGTYGWFTNDQIYKNVVQDTWYKVRTVVTVAWVLVREGWMTTLVMVTGSRLSIYNRQEPC